MIQNVIVAGAGTMGSGIALSFAMKNFKVVLYDTFPQMLDKASAAIKSNVLFLVSKNKITSDESAAIEENISYSNSINDCKGDLVIEAIIENTDAKVSLFRQISSINGSECIVVSNTSSLSISDLQSKVDYPQRIAGLHFFNPAHIMKLVEVIKGEQTSDDVIKTLNDVCIKLDKTPVTCKDSPGFIVNRVARHYYLEAMRMVEAGIADIESIDEIMEASGFKMGPFRLMDMIGMDINLAVSQSLFDAFGSERFRPSTIQIDKVKNGELGRKTGSGFYKY